MPTHLLRGFDDQVCLKVFWLTFGCGSVLGHGFDLSRNKVRANSMNARNLMNTRWSNALVAGSLRVQQSCGDNDKWAKAIETREQQRHLDDAIDDDCTGDFLCASPTANDSDCWRRDQRCERW